MKIAFATKDNELINDHFGWARQFAIYNVSSEGYEFQGMVETPEDHEEEDDKINSKIQALGDVAILFCEAIGPTAAARVTRARIHPIKVKEPSPILKEVEALVQMLKGNPPPWIRRIIAREQTNG